MKRLFLASALLVTALLAPPARAITREQTIVRAKAFAFHPWTATSANLTASCKASYHSVYLPGDYMGLPYDWGGYMTLFDFDQQIAQGYGAGSYPEDGILSCTAGLDCSGFVSKCWDAGHWTTSTVHQTSSTLSVNEMLAGDIFNIAGYHMALYSHTLGSGEPVLYQALGYNVHLAMPGWSWTNGYTPRRYSGITGTSAGNPVGTSTNPIPVTSFPFTDQRNTAQSASDVLDGCGSAPNTKETGPEYIYELTITQPGTLTVSVQDDVGVDIDVHMYTSMNTNDCVARHDASFSYPVDCGTYYVVADTFKGSTEQPGPYTLNITHAPSTQACGSGPPSYQFEGALGADCAYPGNENLPFCNPNLGATTCIYTSTDSFCSKPCVGDNDCAELGGCCADIGNQEFYCLTANLCDDPGGVEMGEDPQPEGDPDVGGAGGAPGSGGAGFGGSGQGSTARANADDDGGEASSGCGVAGRGRGDAAWLLVALWALARRRRQG